MDLFGFDNSDTNKPISFGQHDNHEHRRFAKKLTLICVLILLVSIVINAGITIYAVNKLQDNYEQALKDYKRLTYLPEDYTSIGLNAAHTALPYIVEIKCVESRYNLAAAATGFAISENGYIITCEHVVNYTTTVGPFSASVSGTYSNISAQFDSTSPYYNNGKYYTLQVVATDKDQDLALLKFVTPPAAVMQHLSFADSDMVTIGEEVAVIGNANAFGLSINTGVISSPLRQFAISGSTDSQDVLQTDTAINEGNSGGPALNIYGEVVGVVSFKIVADDTSEGLGFAIVSNTVTGFIDEVCSSKHINVTYTVTERGK